MAGLIFGILRYDYNCYMRNNNYYTLKNSSNDAAEKLRKYSSRIHLYEQSLQRIKVILITHFNYLKNWNWLTAQQKTA